MGLQEWGQEQLQEELGQVRQSVEKEQVRKVELPVQGQLELVQEVVQELQLVEED